MFQDRKNLTILRAVAFGLIFVVIHYFIAKNVFYLSRDMVYGDYSGKAVRPTPQYGMMRVPNNNRFVKPARAIDKLAADFAQIYFPSRKFEELQQSYTDGSFDPWNRASRYAPFVHYLCALSYCQLQYGPASLVHIYLQLFLFYISFIAAFVILKIPRYLPFGILLVNICLFLTPAGLSWFERGQFSLYVAMSYLFVTLGILKRKPVFFLLGGFFAFIKWTTFPVFFVLLSVFILAAGNFKKIRANLLLALPFAVVIAVLFAWFPKEGYAFVQGLYQQETRSTAYGISLVRVLPVAVVKLMPLVLIVLGAFHFRRYQDMAEGWLPFIAGTCIIMLTYPTMAFEYGVCSLCFFIPFAIHWAQWAKDAGWARASVNLLGYGFFFFLLIASCSVFISTATGNEFLIFGVYGLAATVYFLTPLFWHPISARGLPSFRAAS